MKFEEELKNWERYFHLNRQVGHTYSALMGVNNNKSALIVTANLQQQELFPKRKSISFGADISGKYNPVVFDNYTIIRLIQKSLYERIDKSKVLEVIKVICTYEWENCGKRLLNELGLK